MAIALGALDRAASVFARMIAARPDEGRPGAEVRHVGQPADQDGLATPQDVDLGYWWTVARGI